MDDDADRQHLPQWTVRDRSRLEEAYQTIDASIFTGDPMEDEGGLKRLTYFLGRWQKELNGKLAACCSLPTDNYNLDFMLEEAANLLDKARVTPMDSRLAEEMLAFAGKARQTPPAG